MFVRQLVLAGALALPTLFIQPVGVTHAIATQISVAQDVASGARTFAEEPPAPWAEADPADSLYREARETLNRGEYRRAAALFGQITQRYPSSTYAADALYWRA
ncbi:MAG TPA: outer membrane protein assembly factor BamD, partial [Gemmatimonadaceae bacterium]|nr:outer membrane protein assembly factor BamD [Gemmatimonadaceae bacterium]